jgi:hypothetical protein
MQVPNMKTTNTLKTKTAETAFAASLIVFLLVVLPPLGGTAMLIGSAIGLAAYIRLFPDRFRNRRGSLIPAICITAIMLLAALVAVAVSIFRGHWF